ncbi:competence/damage-inducible protein A [Listeria sp. PSOL-1]|uniref:competence/damage-inducible protein A n=1 Tax=Listeria sp. PSOL-1 TaxID=1844999 RepID=UPI0013D808E1|nr:competence/damage-inducible protein A [Listeria sp. PSOL-1]
MKKAEIIAVGTELLLGQIINSNATFLAKELAGLGVYTYYQTVVGDNRERLLEVIKVAESRSDFLIFTGGLGPTEDDITKQVLAEYLGKSLIIDAEHLQKIAHYFTANKRKMTQNNQLQALVIQGAQVLKNDVGFAAGMYLTENKHAYFLLPGPPSEMQPMFTNYAKPIILGLNDEMVHLESRILHFFGIGESKLADDLSDLISKQRNPTIATYASQDEVEIRITATANTKEEALQLLDETELKILKKERTYFYGYGNTSLKEVVSKELLEKKITISAAESLTAGLFQAELASIPGISKIFAGGMVTYSEEIKHHLLKVRQDVIEQEGVVSAACAKEMADHIRLACQTEMGISFTGAVGPDGLGGHPAGTVWIGLSVSGFETTAYLFKFGKDRNMNRRKAVKQGFQVIRNFLDKLKD